MIYPKFPRRTLALILFCLVITLGAVGILFVVYFFNESSAFFMDASLKTIYGNQKQYKKNIIGNSEYNFEQKPTNQFTKTVQESINELRIGNNRSYLLQNSGEYIPISSLSPQELEAIHGKQEILQTKTINTKASKDFNTNLDTIYIDDFDRPTYNSKSKTELNNIDYFDTILVDHKNENDKKISDLRLQEAASTYSIVFKDSFISDTSTNNVKTTNESENKSRINSNRRDNEKYWNKSKIFRYTKVIANANEDDDISDVDIDTVGSGSGDFNDDNEINNIFSKQVKLNLIKAESNPSKPFKKNNIKSSRTRKKHRQHFFNSDNEFISSPPLLSTRSSGGDQSVNNWINQKSLKKLFLYPTVSSPITERIHSSSFKPLKSFSELMNKKWPATQIISNQQNSIINESDNYSVNLATPTYNNNLQSQFQLGELRSTATARIIESSVSNIREIGASENNEAWIETRTRRIMGNVKKSEERSRQLLLCEEAGGGELCRMLFKGHIND